MGCALAHQKGGVWCGHNSKRGVLGAAEAQPERGGGGS